MEASTSKEAAYTHLGLSKKNVKTLAVKIKDWYKVGFQLGLDDYDEDFLDELAADKSNTRTICCIAMLNKWKEVTKVGVADQVETLIRELMEMDGEEDAIQFLSGLLPKNTFNQTTEFMNKDTEGNHIQGSVSSMQVSLDVMGETQESTNKQVAMPTAGCGTELSVEGRSNIDSIVGENNQVISVSGNSRVGNVAVNPVAHTFIQMTTSNPTEEEREEKLQKVVEEKGEHLLKQLQEELISHYDRKNFTQFTPEQYTSCNKIDINDLFTDMIMFQTPHLGNEKKAKEISIEDIAMPYKKKKKKKKREKKDDADDGNPKRILIQGELGNGKTTLMKRLSRPWANDPEKRVFGEKLVFFIELKNMQKEKGFLVNVIENGLPKNILQKLGTTLPVLHRLIVKHEKKFVFLCDGFDELLGDIGNEVVNVFERNELNESVVVVTTRPDNMDELVKVCESHIKIRGFKPERQDEYIRKFFIETPTNGDKLIRLRYDLNYNHIFQMARTPLFLLFLCTLWNINGQVPSTVIELYRELLVCKVNQFLGKQKQRKIDNFNEISPEHLEAMLYVGEATLKGLFEKKLSIKETELKNDNQKQVASKLGLISEESSVSELNHTKSFTTTHKSESEFLASLYVAETMRKRLPESTISHTVKRMLDTPELTQVCKFTVALLGHDAQLFMDYFPLVDFKSSALVGLLEECPDNDVEIVKNSIKQRMNEVVNVTIKSSSGFNIVKELNNFTNAITCTLSTTSGEIDGSDIPNVISSMSALTSLIWDGITDEVFQTFPTSEYPSFTNLSKVSLQGKVSTVNACGKLGSFLYNMKAMTILRLPVISYGPGLYTFVNAMSGHHPCSSGFPSCSNISPSVFKRMQTLTFVLKRTFNKNQRNSGYAHLVSGIMALCPSLESVNTLGTNDEFESNLSEKLTELQAFRNRQIPDEKMHPWYLSCDASVTFPTIDNKNCVSILFQRYKTTYLLLIIHIHEIESKLEFRNCRHMSMPVQLLSQYPDIDVSKSVHLTWYPDFLPHQGRNFEEVQLISRIMAKHEHLSSLSLPCESLANQLRLDEEWMVTHLGFTCNDTNPGQDQCQKYLTRIIDYLSHIKSIQTLTLHPFADAVSYLEKQIPAGFSQELLNKVMFSCPQRHNVAFDKDPLIQLMGQLPKPWLNQMDVDREGNISFVLPTKCEHKVDGSKHTVTSVKDGLQRKINCTMISFCFNLRGLTPCRVQQLLNKLKERVCIDKLFIFPGLVFSNPLALQIITGLKELKEVKLVSFDFDTHTIDNYLTELNMVRKKTLKVFDLPSKQLVSFVNMASGAAITEQSHLSEFQSETSQVKLNIIGNKKVTNLVEVLRAHPQLSDLRIDDYFDGSRTIDNLLSSCDQHTYTSLKSLMFHSKSLNGSQAITLLKCFPNLQKLDLSALQNVEPFIKAVVNGMVLSTGLLLEVDLGDCDLKFQNSGTLIAKFLVSLKNLQIFKVSPTDSKVSASTFIEFLRHTNTQTDNIHRHLRVLSFGELKVDDVGSREVGEMCGRLLLQFPYLESFDMSIFRTGKSTLPSFFTTLTEHHSDQTNIGLRHLDLSGHIFKYDEVKLFVEALETLPNVSELRLEKCRIRANPGNLLDKICHFSKFDLSSSHFKAENHKENFIAQILQFASMETQLVLVETDECFLDSLGGELRSTGIVSSLGYLNLSNSNLSNMVLLKDFLVTFVPKLKTLVLKNCGLNENLLGKLVTDLKSDSFKSGLTTLDMSSSEFCESESGCHLVSIMELFPELLIFRLSDCKITNAVMEQFLKYLNERGQVKLKLRCLVLLNNNIMNSDRIALQVSAHLPLDCKVKVNDAKRSVGGPSVGSHDLLSRFLTLYDDSSDDFPCITQ